MLSKGDVVVLQKGKYDGLEPGMELVVSEAKLKAETIRCTRAGQKFVVKRADVIRRANPGPDLAAKLMNQSMVDFREKRHPCESLMSSGIKVEVMKRR